ncbi:MAG: YdcF family protein [Phycisphaeraceae bacterium]|nr:YdcF family protein [Phycisphaeraceae bacterium]
MNETIDSDARTLWDYHCIPDPPARCDLIMGLGSYDLRVADRCAELLREGCADRILFTGYAGNWTRKLYGKTEAEAFADRAVERGVDRSRLILETEATNLGENLMFARKLLARRGRSVASALVVTKGNTLRRASATAARLWPQLTVRLNCPQPDWDGSPPEVRTREELIEEMVGDLHRMIVYPRRGYQAAQPIPEGVLKAFERLVEAGYDGHLISGEPLKAN